MTGNTNPFVQRQLETARRLEREVVIAYARATSTGLQILAGNCAEPALVDQLNDTLHRAERSLADTLAALGRIGVPATACCGLGPEARAALFEAHFAEAGSGLLSAADIHDLVASIPGLPPAG